MPTLRRRSLAKFASRCAAARIPPRAHSLYQAAQSPARLASQVALMYGVDAQETGATVRLQSAAFAEGRCLHCLSRLHAPVQAPGGQTLPQAVQVADRDLGQPPVTLIVELLILTWPMRRVASPDTFSYRRSVSASRATSFSM